MIQTNRAAAFHSSVACSLLYCAGALAQTAAPAPIPDRPPFYRGSEGVELSVGGFAQLTASRNPGTTTSFGASTVSQQISQSASPSAGVLATVRQSFGPYVGYNVNVGFTRFIENYTSGSVVSLTQPPYSVVSAQFSRGSISTNVFELTGAYVVHAPTRRNFTPFAQLGGGFLTFLPTPTIQPVSYTYRPAGIAGLGVNFRLGPRLELRAEQRVLYYKSPDFRYGAGGQGSAPPVPVSSRYTVTQEPTLSLSHRFGGPRRGMQ